MPPRKAPPRARSPRKNAVVDEPPEEEGLDRDECHGRRLGQEDEQTRRPSRPEMGEEQAAAPHPGCRSAGRQAPQLVDPDSPTTYRKPGAEASSPVSSPLGDGRQHCGWFGTRPIVTTPSATTSGNAAQKNGLRSSSPLLAEARRSGARTAGAVAERRTRRSGRRCRRRGPTESPRRPSPLRRTSGSDRAPGRDPSRAGPAPAWARIRSRWPVHPPPLTAGRAAMPRAALGRAKPCSKRTGSTPSSVRWGADPQTAVAERGALDRSPPGGDHPSSGPPRMHLALVACFL